jgi:tRNA pseudouridine38-40 synthase
LVQGRHDFSAFQGSGSQVVSTVRTLRRVRISRQGPAVELEFAGNGFLRQMVRSLVGTLVEVGRGKRDPDEMREILNSRDRRRAGVTAPARGLTLVAVRYR